MDIYGELKKYKPYNELEADNVASVLAFIDKFGDDVWTRDNLIGHICVSAWVVNKEHTKVLMAHHNIYCSYDWLGGHADGDRNLLEVAKKEVFEESGLKNIKVLNDGNIFDVNMQFVIPHIKRGKNITAHLHLAIVYLFEADEKDELIVNEDENSALKWIENEKVFEVSKSEHMRPIYSRLMEKVKNLF